ncbi:MAG: toprim domain-containing protein [Candidatus Thermoplasmatota archaeon]|nr:toprim domain-containing protein [Candidatus Thermoplasmatota archaeon]
MKDNSMEPIIVEGDHDVKALREVGITGEIIKINQGISIENFCSRISSQYSKVILLTDFDRKGNELQSKISEILQSYGCKINSRFWYFIDHSFKIKSVEDLPWLLQENQ